MKQKASCNMIFGGEMVFGEDVTKLTPILMKARQLILLATLTLTISFCHGQGISSSIEKKNWLFNIAMKFELGMSNYYYGKNTTDWIGQHGGPCVNFTLIVNHLDIGYRIKPWSVIPKKELNFNGIIVPTTAILNPVKKDFYVGYSFDFNNLISIEPYVGYNFSSFIVINEDELNQQFDFNKTGGLIIGTSFYKYFDIKEPGYFSVFGTVGYGFINYSKVHQSLDNGYFEWSLGIAYKSSSLIFGRRKFRKNSF